MIVIGLKYFMGSKWISQPSGATCTRYSLQPCSRHTFCLVNCTGHQVGHMAHSYVRNRTPFEICFARTPRSNLVSLLLLREATYCKKHLFPFEELFIVSRIYFRPWVSPLRGSFRSCFLRRFSLLWQRQGRFVLVPKSTRHMRVPHSV